MTRGVGPRQPGKAKRQTAVRAKRGPEKAIGPAPAPRKAPPARVALKKESRARAPKGYNPVDPLRVQAILDTLAKTYPNVRCALNHENAWQLLIATILSAQCTDVRVNMVTPELFRMYPTPQAMAAVKPEVLEPEIKSTGFFRNKAKSIVGASRKIVEDFGGQVPDDMDQLLSLPGVARKTANVVLGSWFGKAVGVVVDTHVHRISRRLELTAADDAQKIEQDLMNVIPKDRWIAFSHEIIHHGRALCVARNPKCAECPLETLCHAADKTWSTVDVHPNAR